MFRLYSKGCEYAIRALLHMAPTQESQRFQARDIFNKADIPESFTRKIFQDLVAGGLLSAVPGPGGGYAIVRPPNEISLLEVIEALDGPVRLNRCVIEPSACPRDGHCPVHHIWAKAQQELTDLLQVTTFEELTDPPSQ